MEELLFIALAGAVGGVVFTWMEKISGKTKKTELEKEMERQFGKVLTQEDLDQLIEEEERKLGIKKN